MAPLFVLQTLIMKLTVKRPVLNPAFKRFQVLPDLLVGMPGQSVSPAPIARLTSSRQQAHNRLDRCLDRQPQKALRTPNEETAQPI
jgi:hypothetical protein